jgi:hypothetical protein
LTRNCIAVLDKNLHGAGYLRYLRIVVFDFDLAVRACCPGVALEGNPMAFCILPLPLRTEHPTLAEP